MAYLDNSVVTVDAVLTKKGRERLGQGRNAFVITKFAVSDDEIDYSLYNTAHPLGTNYYSNIIESMPVLEAVPDESQVMRYKLVSLQNQNGIARLPRIINIQTTYDALEPGESLTLDPDTLVTTVAGTLDRTLDETAGYTLILFDEEAADVIVPGGAGLPSSIYTPPAQVGLSDASSNLLNINFSSNVVRSGYRFQLVAKDVTTTKNTRFTIFGNESGATVTVSLTVNPRTTT